MKGIFKVATLLLALSFQACIQDHQPVMQLVLQPDADKGKDALFSSGGPTTKYGNIEDLFISTHISWTISRVAIQFDLSSIPENATIQQANLYLYFNPTSIYLDLNRNNTGHLGYNDFLVQRATTPWDESTVTWDTQPQSTSTNQIHVPFATSKTQNYIIDVTQLIQEMVSNPANNYGFFLRHLGENPVEEKYTFLASSDHPNSALHPKLEVRYVVK